MGADIYSCFSFSHLNVSKSVNSVMHRSYFVNSLKLIFLKKEKLFSSKEKVF